MTTGPGLPLPALEPGPRSETPIENPPVLSAQIFPPIWARIKRCVWGGRSINNSNDGFLEESNADGSSALSRDSLRHNEHPHIWTNIGGTDAEPEQVDCVVVDTSFWHLIGSEEAARQPNKAPHENAPHSVTTSPPHPDSRSTTRSIWDRWPSLSLLRFGVIPRISKFNRQSFDPVTELQYTAEAWFNSKHIAFMGSLWLIINWILACGFSGHPLDMWGKMFFYVFGPLFCIPLPVMVIFDFPKKRPVIYQSMLMVSVWSWAINTILTMYLCGFYGSRSHWSCGHRDFLNLLYYSTALPAVGMFALSMARIPTLVGSVTFITLSSALLVPYRRQFIRNVINSIIFHMFLLYMHYLKEKTDRHLFTMRNQLRVQFRHATESSKNEKLASDSKRRLTSYIFHEVRVPLNTAMLALQNLEASFPIGNDHGIELSALQASLGMMSKVLSDILDFNRMDAGRFETVRRPYAFHRAVRSLMVGLQMAADAKGLQVITDFDRNVDIVARAAAFREQGKTEDWIVRQLSCEPDKDAFVMGDEMRFIQVLTNLMSNACKFTPGGPDGKIIVRTRLVYPPTPRPCQSPPPRPPLESESTNASGSTAVAGDESQRHSSAQDSGLLHPVSLYNNHLNHQPGSKNPPNIVVRIEVLDTGVGISPRDMVDNRLFSPYVQTEIGRHQGGKGTGLGLALVSSIVKLSGGRLGVRSKRNEGSCFWVELPLGVVPAILETTEPDKIPTSSSPPPPPSLVPVVNPFLQKYTPDGTTDVYTSNSELTASSQAPSKFFDVVGPAMPPENRDSVHLGLQEAGALPSLPFMHPMIPPPIFSLYNKVSNFSVPPVPRASSLPHVYSSPQLSTPTIPSLVPLRPPKEPVKHPTRTSHFFPPIFHSAPPRPPFTRTPSSPPIMSHVTSEPMHHRTNSDRLIKTSKEMGADGGSLVPIHALVVDDDQLTRRLMVRMLQRMGCTVETAENGQKALDIILRDEASPSDKFGIVFLDNQMPVLSGVEMVKQLRERGRTEFIVGITGNALKEDQVEYMEAGLDRVLIKPVLERSLKEMLSLALDRRRTS